jgi:hypothetical protein
MTRYKRALLSVPEVRFLDFDTLAVARNFLMHDVIALGFKNRYFASLALGRRATDDEARRHYYSYVKINTNDFIYEKDLCGKNNFDFWQDTVAYVKTLLILSAALSDDNVYYSTEKLGHFPSEEEAIMYYLGITTTNCTAVALAAAAVFYVKIITI